VLQLYGKNQYAARKKYRDFVEKGIGLGRNPEMTGGGLLRSIGGWGVLKSIRKMNIHIKGGISHVKIYHRRIGFMFSQRHYSGLSGYIHIDGSLGIIHKKWKNRLEKLNTCGFHRPGILRMD
jgi:hypothetical protein